VASTSAVVSAPGSCSGTIIAAAGRLRPPCYSRAFHVEAQMTASPETALVRELRARIHELELQNTDLKRQVTELRAAVSALMEPDMPRILRTPGGIMVLDAH
jgi:hypothetical protein